MKLTSLAPLLVLAACAPGTVQTTGTSTPGPVHTTVIQTGAGDYSLSRVSDRVETSFVAQSPIDAVWNALPAAYQKLGIAPAGVMTASDHIFGANDWRSNGRINGAPASRFVDCGQVALGQAAADESALVLRVVTSLHSEGTGTTSVAMTVQGTATPRTGGGVTYPCSSTGELEKQLSAAIVGSLQ